MAIQIANTLMAAFTAYFGVGLIFGLAFVFMGAKRIDPTAKDGSWGFRLAILPAAATLWPYLAYRWMSGATAPPSERNAHRDASGCKGGCCGCSGGDS